MAQKNILIDDRVENALSMWCKAMGFTQQRAVAAAILAFMEADAETRERSLLRLIQVENGSELKVSIFDKAESAKQTTSEMQRGGEGVTPKIPNRRIVKVESQTRRRKVE